MSASKKDLWSAAIDAFETGHHARLDLLCQHLLLLEPGNFPVRMLRAHALLKMKRFADAGSLLEGANPDDERKVVLWHRTAGDYYAERGDYEAAEDEYASALAIADVATSDLVLDMVEAQLNQGNSEGALRSVLSFMSGQGEGEVPDDQELLAFAEARALRNLGQTGAALEAAKRAAALGEKAGGFPDGEALVLDLAQVLAWETKLAAAMSEDASAPAE